jgi:drug/metabolite transporter (DMT)-like permease
LFASLLSLIAAAAYGVGDFFGAIASRRTHPILVSFIGHIFYAVTAFLGLLLIQGQWSSVGTWVGLATGASEALGFLVFYYALTLGRVAMVAPLVSVIYAIVPVVWGLGTGDQLSTTGWLGVGLGLLAVLALSMESDTSEGYAKKPLAVVLTLSLVGGVMWGFSTVALSYAPENSGMVPVFLAGCTAFGFMALIVLAKRKKMVQAYASDALAPSVWSGVLFGVANLFIITALRYGTLSLVGLLTALYPLATVFLARFILKEQIGRVQWFGIAFAVLAAALLSQG